MKSICLYLHIHQPERYRTYSVFDIGERHNYWDADFYSKQSNERIFKKVSEKSYRPTLKKIEKALSDFPEFRISFSITGTWIEQAERWDPELLQILRRIADTGRAEIVGETYYHSLSFFFDREEFETQVSLHREKIGKVFGVTPRVFRNTELAYNDELASWADHAGFDGILAEGWDKILGWRSPNFLYRPKNCKDLKLLLKNYRFSDDIAFRFSDKSWKEYPLTVEKYISWLESEPGDRVNLFMDFETFGEHQWAKSGIFTFMDDLVKTWIDRGHTFLSLSESCEGTPADEISMPDIVTWADTERDLSAWYGNSMQREAVKNLFAMKDKIYASKDSDLIRDFRRLTTSDHIYYMCTKYWNDGDVHAYFSAYDNPYDAFLYFMNIIRDLEYRLHSL